MLTAARNTVEDNVCFGQVPYPQDLGFAQCRSCFGEAESPQLQLQEHDSKPTRRWKTRKKLGWAGQAFFDTRIQLLKMKLSDKNAERFASMTYDRQCTIVGKMIEKGLMI